MRVSPACDRCYAAAIAQRFGWRDNEGRELWDVHAGRKRTSEAYWHGPLRWNRDAQAVGERRRVFCASMADIFDNHAPEVWRVDLWDLIRATPECRRSQALRQTTWLEPNRDRNPTLYRNRPAFDSDNNYNQINLKARHSVLFLL
jgi:protein gp37